MSNTSSLRVVLAIAVVIAGGALAYYDVQLNHSRDSVASLTAERDQLTATVAQLSAVNAHEAMPELPTSVSFHRALLGGRSYVAEFGSHGATDMAIAVEWVDAATHNHRNFRVDIQPGRPTPLGHIQGYDFEPGDELTMSHDGYKPVTAEVR